MRKEIYIMFFIMLSMTFISFGDVVIGNFEDLSDPNHEGWVKSNASNPNITLSYSKNGVTLDSNSLKIADSTGNGFERAVSRGVMSLVNEFKSNHKLTIDVTRMAGDWGGPHGGYNEVESYLGYSELMIVIEAGRDVNDHNGLNVDGNHHWQKGWDLSQRACWGSWNGDQPITYTYDYSAILNQIDFDNLGYLGITIATNWGNYIPGGVYYIDNVKLIGSGKAYNPTPANHAVDVPPGQNLNWSDGTGAVAHDVYCGTSFNDVNDANRAIPKGVLKIQGQTDASYIPTLELYKTYYWRIDEVNSLGGIEKGDVWDFMTAFSGMGTVLADFENGMNGWEKTWQGNTTLTYSPTQSTLGKYSLAVQTAKNTSDDPSYWILKREGQLDLSNKKLEVDVTLIGSEWNGETVHLGPLVVQASLPVSWSIYIPSVINRKTGFSASEAWGGVGANSAYRTLVFDFTGIDNTGYIHNDWVNVMDPNKSMRLFLALQNGDQGRGKFYVDNVRLIDVRLASNPRPGTLATDVNTTPTLSWTAGKGSVTGHDVYFGTVYPPSTKVSSNQAGTSYKPSTLQKGKTYYWRIDERTSGGVLTGMIWQFTTAEYEFLEDFEKYTNVLAQRIGTTWIKNGGGKVGYDSNDYAEITIVHSGLQSMPFDYNNFVAPYDSNATRTFTAYQDWTAQSIKSLEFWYRGWPATVGTFTGTSTYTMTGTGEDIWNVADLRGSKYHDEFHYAYKQINSGDGDGWVTVIAKVDSITGDTSPWTKAGIMVRQTLDANSVNGLMCITPEKGAVWQYRPAIGEGSISYDYYTRGDDYLDLKDITAPYWVELVLDTYNGNVYPYYSPDGSNWSPVQSAGSPTITLPFYVGMAVTAHNSKAVCSAQFSDVSIVAGSVPASWNHQDIGIRNNIAAPLYITLQDDSSVGGDKATVTQTDTSKVLSTEWQAWDIALSDFKAANPNLNLDKIKKITLGVGHKSGDPYAKGTMYFDDIRLYPPRCMFGKTADLTGDCFVDFKDLRILATNWLSSSFDPNVDLYKDSKINFKDFAIMAESWFETALWPN
jgi:hypothetical protein